MSQSGIDESSSLVEGNTIGPNNTFVVELNTVSPLLVDLVANYNLAFADETNFIKLIELVNKNRMFVVSSWF